MEDDLGFHHSQHWAGKERWEVFQSRKIWKECGSLGRLKLRALISCVYQTPSTRDRRSGTKGQKERWREGGGMPDQIPHL